MQKNPRSLSYKFATAYQILVILLIVGIWSGLASDPKNLLATFNALQWFFLYFVSGIGLFVVTLIQYIKK